ncbi:sugar phosphate isomerase/epimerase family protein [Prochlorococcus marinus]|uniref:sugar phosphate isomerase/epimerase family protein n=1 Tax=Prochlorococcus marinus TaxID=1219 RepID=UPI0022B2BEE1|nr:TIM barrel protein [Prochlorococcus marinus]
MKLSVNTGFLVNRYPSPRQWCEVINQLGVKNIQITADLFNPSYPDKILSKQVDEINKLKNDYGFTIYSAFTGAFTRVNHFCHPDEDVRNYWLNWFVRYADYASKIGVKRLGSHIGILSVPDNKTNRNFYRDICVTYWNKLYNEVSKFGIEELTWEHMSIEREQGHTQKDIDWLLRELSREGLPINLCLDPDHGDLSSSNNEDYEPYGLIEKYANFSSQLHLKQISKDKRKNSPFTTVFNKTGLVKANKVIKLLLDKIDKQKHRNFELILELNAREREPDDSNIVMDIQESLNYWKSALDDLSVEYE